MSWIKKAWYDPVWSKVIAGLILGIISFAPSINAFIRGTSFGDYFAKSNAIEINNVHLALLIACVVGFILFVIIKISNKNTKIEYLENAVEIYESRNASTPEPIITPAPPVLSKEQIMTQEFEEFKLHKTYKYWPQVVELIRAKSQIHPSTIPPEIIDYFSVKEYISHNYPKYREYYLKEKGQHFLQRMILEKIDGN